MNDKIARQMWKLDSCKCYKIIGENSIPSTPKSCQASTVITPTTAKSHDNKRKTQKKIESL